jgi:hypothetical protein
MLSICAKLLQWRRYFGICSSQIPHTYSVSQLLPSHVYLSSNRHRKSAQIHVYTHGLENWLLLCSQLVPNCFDDAGILEYAVHQGTPHIFGLSTTTITCVFVKQWSSKNRWNWRLYTRARELTAFMLSTCAKLLQWWRYFGLSSTQVSHTYSVSQLLSSHVYVSSNRHRKPL